jgi:methylmalonyl-CoA mutase
MSQATTSLDLAADFQPATEEQWRDLVNKAIKGADFEKRLVSRTADGIAIQPLYMQTRSARPIAAAISAQPWRIAQRVDHPDPVMANTMALADLEGGTDTLTIVAPDSIRAAGYGVALNSISDLERTLQDISLDMIALRLEPAVSGKQSAALLAAYIATTGTDPTTLKINFGLAPLAVLATAGSLATDWLQTTADMAQTVEFLRNRGFTGPLVTNDLRPIHEAGGSESQELAVALASGVAYLRALTDNGHSPEAAARTLSWTIAVDADQFMGLAKLRALRQLWARVEEASGITPHPIAIHAETAWRMMSRRDPAVNMLRTTMATATAAIAGADSIAVLPYTLPLGLPNAFARRIARNTQTVLAEESNLWRVADPAAGSGAYETLTDALCEKAWTAFQEIEAEGGLAESLATGRLQARIAGVREAREKDVARRRIALTGTSEFPNLAEVDETVLDVAPSATRMPGPQRHGEASRPINDLIERFTAGASLAEVSPPPAMAMRAEPLPSLRLSEPFEALRAASDRQLAAAGERPRIFLANLGPLAEHGARATWIRNLLAAGGIDALTNDGFTNSADTGKAFSESGAAIVCICGSDETYGQMVEATASLLKQAGADRVYVAGRPGDNEAGWRQAGVDAFLYAGIDVLSALSEIHATLDVR